MASREVCVDDCTYQISYEVVNPSQKKCMLILHGWGSNKELMKQAFHLHFHNFTHLYIDLPGFGNSTIEKALDSDAYAKVIKCFLKVLDFSPEVVMGHSFGGKIAALLEPKKIILLSSAGVVLPKSKKVRLKIALFKLLKYILPKSFYRFFTSQDVQGMSEIMYETFKKVVNEDFVPIFSKLQSKSALFWGKNDNATPLISAEIINQALKNSQLFILDGDHYFFMNQAALVERKSMKVLYEDLQMYN